MFLQVFINSPFPQLCKGAVLSGRGSPPRFLPAALIRLALQLCSRSNRLFAQTSPSRPCWQGNRHHRASGNSLPLCARRGEKGRTAAIKRGFKYPSVASLCICTFPERCEAVPGTGLPRCLQGASRQPVTVQSSYGKPCAALTGNHQHEYDKQVLART